MQRVKSQCVGWYLSYLAIFAKTLFFSSIIFSSEILLSVAVKDFVKHKARIYVAKFRQKESRSGHLGSRQLPAFGGGIVLPSALKQLCYFAFPQMR